MFLPFLRVEAGRMKRKGKEKAKPNEGNERKRKASRSGKRQLKNEEPP